MKFLTTNGATESLYQLVTLKKIKIMTLKKQFQVMFNNTVPNENRVDKSIKIAEEFAIGFAHFLAEHTYSCYESGWSNDFGNKELTTKELLEIYNKEKGL